MFADEISPHDDSLFGASLRIGTTTLESHPRCGGLSGSAACCGMADEEDDVESPDDQIDEDENHTPMANDDEGDQTSPALDIPVAIGTPPADEVPARVNVQNIGPGALPRGDPNNVRQETLIEGGTLADFDPKRPPSRSNVTVIALIRMDHDVLP